MAKNIKEAMLKSMQKKMKPGVESYVAEQKRVGEYKGKSIYRTAHNGMYNAGSLKADSMSGIKSLIDKQD